MIIATFAKCASYCGLIFVNKGHTTKSTKSYSYTLKFTMPLNTTTQIVTQIMKHSCGLPNMEQILTPFQVNKNNILLSTTLECSYLLLLLHCICVFLNLQYNYGYLLLFCIYVRRRRRFLANRMEIPSLPVARNL